MLHFYGFLIHFYAKDVEIFHLENTIGTYMSYIIGLLSINFRMNLSIFPFFEAKHNLSPCFH